MENLKKIIKGISIVTLSLSLFACENAKQETPDILSANKIKPKINLEQAARYNVQLAINYLQQGNTARAKEKLNRAQKLAPKLSDVHYSYAYYLETTGEIAEAENYYKKAIALNSGGREHNNYGVFLCKQHRYIDAQEQFALAIKDQNYITTGEAYENAALCNLSNNKLAKAREGFQKALLHDSKRYKSLIELADLSLNDKDFSKADTYLSRYNAIKEPSARSLLLGIKTAAHFKNFDKVSSLALLLKNEFPKSPEFDEYQNIRTDLHATGN